MTTSPDHAFPHLADPTTPAACRRQAIACRSSAIVLDLEGQLAAAAALRAKAELLEHPAALLADSWGGDAA